MNLYNDNLRDCVASLPGIFNVSSNLNDENLEYNPIRIFFEVSSTDNTGLFFLTRCCDRRYWEYGYLWKIELSVGDLFKNNELPIYYMLHSANVYGDEAMKQAIDLIDNMNHHLNHIAFMDGFELKRSNFEKSFLSYHRKKKLKSIEKL